MLLVFNCSALHLIAFRVGCVSTLPELERVSVRLVDFFYHSTVVGFPVFRLGICLFTATLRIRLVRRAGDAISQFFLTSVCLYASEILSRSPSSGDICGVQHCWQQDSSKASIPSSFVGRGTCVFALSLPQAHLQEASMTRTDLHQRRGTRASRRESPPPKTVTLATEKAAVRFGLHTRG